MKRTHIALLTALMALGCAPLPGQNPAATFKLGEAAGGADETTFLDASGQTFSLQSLGVTTLLVRYNHRVRGKVTPPGGVRIGTLPRGVEMFRFDSPAVAARALKLLKADRLVELAEPDAPLKTMAPLAGPTLANGFTNQPYLAESQINASAAWAIEAGDGAGSSFDNWVAVIDTGLDTDHPEFWLSQEANAGTTNLNFSVDPADTAYEDANGHGTQVAGLIAAKAVGSDAFIGVAPLAKILALKVGGTANSGQLDTAAVIRALDFARAQPNVRVINMSLGSRVDSPALREAVDAAVLAGKVVVAAAGNEGRTTKTYPAAYPGVLAVAASRLGTRAGVTALQRARFSNYGPWVGIIAPGTDIYTTQIGGGFTTVSGTSMAAPLVSGAAALVRAVCHANGLASTSEQIRRRLQESAQITVSGMPFLNVGKAVDFTTSAELPADRPPVVVGNRVSAKPGVQAHSEINISWASDEPVAPEVWVREQTGSSRWTAAAIESNPTATAAGNASSLPTVAVEGLQPGKLYNYIVKATDEGGNTSTSTFVGTIRTKALGSTKVSVSKSPYSPVLKWTTTFPANREVYFGTDPDLTTSTTISIADVYETKHQVVLPRLNPATTYYYRVRVADSDNFASMVIPAITASAASFKTDAVKFARSTVVSHSAGHHVSWSTSVPGQSELWFGTLRDDVATSGACVNTCAIATNSEDLRLAHSVSLDRPSDEGLFVRPVIRDGAMEARGSVLKVGTPKLKAYEIAYTDTIASESILSFRTDRRASATVFIATGTIPLADIDAEDDAASFTILGSGPDTHFRVPLTGLAPATRYFAWLRLEPVFPNNVGSATVVPAGSFLTPAAP